MSKRERALFDETAIHRCGELVDFLSSSGSLRAPHCRKFSSPVACGDLGVGVERASYPNFFLDITFY